MKKIKLMLVSFSVLAIVGAALAFNVRGTTEFCTAATVNNSCTNVVCPNDRTGDPNSTGVIICTTPTSGDINNPCKDSKGNTLNCQTPTTTFQLD